MLSTQDIVHEVVIATMSRLDRFEDRGEGALLAYLRMGVLNRIRDELRKAKARPVQEDLDEQQPSSISSPIEEAIGAETYESYLRALQSLNPRYAQAIVLHVELGYELDDLAQAIEAPTPHAARMTLRRALETLAKAMSDAA